MRQRPGRTVKVMRGGSALSFEVVSRDAASFRVEGDEVHLIPEEFVYDMDGSVGMSIGRLDWIDGRIAQIVIEREGPAV